MGTVSDDDDSIGDWYPLINQRHDAGGRLQTNNTDELCEEARISFRRRVIP